MGRGRRSSGSTKTKKRKKVVFRVLDREHAGQVTAPYRMMEDLIEHYHEHLRDARIVIAYRKGWNADPEGIQKLGQAKKASDLDRELKDVDFIILLNEEAWGTDWTRVDFDARKALVCQSARDMEGVKEDAPEVLLINGQSMRSILSDQTPLFAEAV